MLIQKSEAMAPLDDVTVSRDCKISLDLADSIVSIKFLWNILTNRGVMNDCRLDEDGCCAPLFSK